MIEFQAQDADLALLVFARKDCVFQQEKKKNKYTPKTQTT